MAVYKDKGRWRYRFTYAGKRYSGSAPPELNTKVAVEREQAKHVEQVQSGVKPAPLLAEFGSRYKAHQKARTKPLTYRAESGRVDRIVEAFGNVPLDRIDRAAIDAACTAWVAAELEPSTINLRLSTLEHMFSLALDWSELRKRPAIEKLDEPEPSPRWLTEDEAERLLNAAGAWRPMMFVAMRTGLRIGELRGLQWSDIDLARRVLVVRRTHPGRPRMDATEPKSNKHRAVPLSTDCAAELADIPERCEWVFPAARRYDKARWRPWSEKGCYDAIVRAAKLAGLEDVGWHTLRHTFASWLVMRGFKLQEVQAWLGHYSVKQTEVYAHLAPGSGHDRISMLDVPLAVPSGANVGPDDTPGLDAPAAVTRLLPSGG